MKTVLFFLLAVLLALLHAFLHFFGACLLVGGVLGVLFFGEDFLDGGVELFTLLVHDGAHAVALFLGHASLAIAAGGHVLGMFLEEGLEFGLLFFGEAILFGHLFYAGFGHLGGVHLLAASSLAAAGLFGVVVVTHDAGHGGGAGQEAAECD